MRIKLIGEIPSLTDALFPIGSNGLQEAVVGVFIGITIKQFKKDTRIWAQGLPVFLQEF